MFAVTRIPELVAGRAVQFEKIRRSEKPATASPEQIGELAGRGSTLSLAQIIDVHDSVAMTAQPVEDGGLDTPEEAFALETEFLVVVPVAAAIDDDGVVGREGWEMKFPIGVLLAWLSHPSHE